MKHEEQPVYVRNKRAENMKKEEKAQRRKKINLHPRVSNEVKSKTAINPPSETEIVSKKIKKSKKKHPVIGKPHPGCGKELER